MKAKFVFLATFLFTMSGQAWAESYKYFCRDFDNFWHAKIELSSDHLVIYDQRDGNGSGKKGDLHYFSHGLVGGEGRLRTRILYKFSHEQSDILATRGMDKLFVGPELVKGGVKLYNNELGGFIHRRYSDARLTCFRMYR